MLRSHWSDRLKQFLQHLARPTKGKLPLLRIPSQRQRLLYYLVIFALFQLFLVFFLNKEQNRDRESYFQHILEQEKISHSASFAFFRNQAQFLCNTVTNRPEILSLLREAAKGDPREKEILRRQLYEIFSPTYSLMRKDFFPQVHFILADGTSFLRMHQPEEFGDNLLATRPSIKTACQEKRYVEGFEFGRHTEAYRFIFPLFHEGTLLGCLDFSLPPALFHEIMAQQYDAEYEFILKKSLADPKFTPSSRKKYLTSALSEKFYQELEKEPFHSPEHAYHLSPEILTAINLTLKNTIEPSLEQGIPFAHSLKMGDKHIIITFQPVLDLERQLTGYRISYRKDNHLSSSRPHFIQLYLAGTALFLLLLVLHGHFSRIQITRHRFQQKLIDAIPTPIFYYDTNGIFQDANKSFLETTGLSREGLQNLKIDQVFPNLPKAAMPDLPQWALNPEKILKNELRIRDANGTPQDIVLHQTIIACDDANKPCLVIGACFDITTLKQSQLATQDAFLELDQIFNSASDGMWVIGTDFTCLKVNDTLLGMLQKDREQILHTKCFETFCEKDCQTKRCPLIRIKNGEKRIEEEVHKFSETGGKLTFLRTATPFLNKEGTLLGIVESFKDITKQHQALNELIAAKEAAVLASQAKSEFLANMSHEVRTPLNGILGMTTLTLGTGLNEKQQQYLGMIKKSGERLLGILNQILDFSKLEAGKLELDATVFSLRDLLGEVFTPCAVQLEQRGITSTIAIAQDIPNQWRGDAGRLRQILTNLLDNAGKFTEQGSIALQVELADRTEEKTTLHFSVQDTGIGIAQEKQQDIFTPFIQADGSMTRKFGGTGLGLTICQQLIAMMGGSIWLESVEGHGSTFHFSIPFSQMPKKAELPAPTDRDLQEIRLLVIRDSSGQPLGLDQISPDSFKQMDSIAPPTAWPLILPHSSYDLLLISMGGEDCFGMIEKIRQDERLRQTPIIFVTPSGFRGDALRYRNLGVGAYLTGIISREELQETMRLVLSQAASPQAETELITRHTLRETRKTQETNDTPHILVVDDDFVNRVLAEEVLKIEGWRVSIAENGEQALDLLANQQIDLVLMDMQMPVMDGFTAIGTIRKTEQNTGKHLPIIALTGFAFPEDQEKCLTAGADEYLSKPFKPEELVSMVKQRLQQEK